MKNLLIALLFIAVIAAGIAGIPPLLRHALGVDQPLMTVISGSMWPALSRGDIVIVVKTDKADIKVGSVVVFKHQNGFAVHRVVSLDKWTLTTKGDANPVADDPIYYTDVVGRVPAIGSKLVKIPWVGNIALLANPNAGATAPGETNNTDFWGQLLRLVLSPVGFIIIIGFPLVLFFQDTLKNAYYAVVPVSTRKRRQRARARRLEARWGEARVQHALRMR